MDILLLLLEPLGELLLELFAESLSKLLATMASSIADVARNLVGW